MKFDPVSLAWLGNVPMWCSVILNCTMSSEISLWNRLVILIVDGPRQQKGPSNVVRALFPFSHTEHLPNILLGLLLLCSHRAHPRDCDGHLGAIDDGLRELAKLACIRS
eukprot:643874-Prorocentrum_minimum.AAC.2